MPVRIKLQKFPGIERDVVLSQYVIRRQQPELRVRGEEGGNHVLIFGAQETARRINQPAAGLHERSGSGKDRALLGGKLCDDRLRSGAT